MRNGHTEASVRVIYPTFLCLMCMKVALQVTRWRRLHRASKYWAGWPWRTTSNLAMKAHRTSSGERPGREKSNPFRYKPKQCMLAGSGRPGSDQLIPLGSREGDEPLVDFGQLPQVRT